MNGIQDPNPSRECTGRGERKTAVSEEKESQRNPKTRFITEK